MTKKKADGSASGKPTGSPARGRQSSAFRALVAGVGNVLRGDDGFGPAVIEALQRERLNDGVELREFGIGGLHLVQELMGTRFDGLILIDAVDRDAAPGTLFELTAEVPAVADLPADESRLHEVDLHQTDPSRILIMARALGVLPDRVRIIGCQPATTELATALSPGVSDAVGGARDIVLRLLGVWDREYHDAGLSRDSR